VITLDKLKIFSRYKGDVDQFGRAGRTSEKQVLTNDEWGLIDMLLQDAVVINRNLGSEARTASAWRRLHENSEDDAVVTEIRRLAEKM
jgi:hypothetical protein